MKCLRLIAAFSFASLLLTSCGRIDNDTVGGEFGRYQITVGGPLQASGASADDRVVYRIDTMTGELERLIEVPVLDAGTDEVLSAEYMWERVNVNLDWVDK